MVSPGTAGAAVSMLLVEDERSPWMSLPLFTAIDQCIAEIRACVNDAR